MFRKSLIRLISILAVIALFVPACLASGIDEGTAIMMISDADPTAGEGTNYFFPSNNSSGAWVFCETDSHDSDSSYYEGSFWYVDYEEATRLGSGSKIRNFDLYSCDPELFICAYVSNGKNICQAAIIVDDQPVKLKGASLFTDIWQNGECITANVAGKNGYCIITFDERSLIEVVPVELSPDETGSTRYASDFKYIEREIFKSYPDAEIVSYLYYDTGAICVNLIANDIESHLYVFKTKSGPMIETSWDGPAVIDGFISGNAYTKLERYYSEYPD